MSREAKAATISREDNTNKNKRQRKVSSKLVSDQIIKYKKMEEEIQILKKKNSELEHILSTRERSCSTNDNSSLNFAENFNIRLGVQEIKTIVPEFDPSNSTYTSVTWLNNIESLKMIYGWNDRLTLFYATARLAGAAASWYIARQTEIIDWEKFKIELINSFPSTIDTSSILLKIMTRKRETNECIEKYFYDMVALGKKINLPEKTVIKHIISNINNEVMSTILMSFNHTDITLNQLLRHIKQCEEIQETERQSKLLHHKFTFPKQKQFAKSENRFHPFKNNQKTKNNTDRKYNERRCYKCNQIGHLANTCSTKVEKKCYNCNNVGHISRDCKLRGVKKIEKKDPLLKNELYRFVYLEGKKILAFLDMGSECTTLRLSDAHKLDYKIFENCESILCGFGGEKHQVIGRIHKNIKVDNFEFKTEILVVEDQTQSIPMIIGKNFMDNPGLKIVKRLGRLDFEQDTTQEKFNGNKSINCGRKPITKEQISIKITSEKIAHDLEILVNKYRDCFALDISELGRTSVEEMKICLKEDKVVRYRPYKVAYALLPTLDKIINELLQFEIIQPSKSEFASPILLIKKKEGDYRMCVDYRKLNSITKREAFPVPNIEETLNSLANKTVFTSLDLLSGYYQIKVAEECRHLTSFVTTKGQYEFTRMPFGLTNSPAIFMRVIAKVIEPLKTDEIIVYMDDILIATTTIERNIELLQQFLKVLQEAGLTLKLEKCVFFFKSPSNS